ncbi:hypothetical protein FRACA_3770005 [Frankia canadensis]|uniref:Uncharacterized protein n=1 Tax=Frankia canadensis TaxID=1836972 RepID=A0A2I2KVY0_9ACTN|nr:hypothetical protein FRACA_3770005 [Frankia canadensis]SOU57096.1 hypothetical protein FRACA_3770005 [Frankia canadensis]
MSPRTPDEMPPTPAPTSRSVDDHRSEMADRPRSILSRPRVIHSYRPDKKSVKRANITDACLDCPQEHRSHPQVIHRCCARTSMTQRDDYRQA